MFAPAHTTSGLLGVHAFWVCLEEKALAPVIGLRGHACKSVKHNCSQRLRKS